VHALRFALTCSRPARLPPHPYRLAETTNLNFGCRGTNDDILTDPFCSPGASRVTFNATQTSYFLVVAGFSNGVGAYSINYAYLQPSGTPTPTQTPSASQSGTGTVTPGLPPSQSASQSPRAPSLSNTPSISETPSNTPSNTPSPSQRPNCFDNGANYTAILTGFSGTYFHSGLAAIGAGGVNYISGTCGAVSPLATYSQHRYAIDVSVAAMGARLARGDPLPRLCIAADVLSLS
jgi:hypothetical protein